MENQITIQKCFDTYADISALGIGGTYKRGAIEAIAADEDYFSVFKDEKNDDKTTIYKITQAGLEFVGFASRPNFIIDQNHVYNAEIPTILDTDPVRASTSVNPLCWQIINNLDAIRRRVDDLPTNGGGGDQMLFWGTSTTPAATTIKDVVIPDGAPSTLRHGSSFLVAFTAASGTGARREIRIGANPPIPIFGFDTAVDGWPANSMVEFRLAGGATAENPLGTFILTSVAGSREAWNRWVTQPVGDNSTLTATTAFVTTALTQLPNNSVANASLANMPADTFKGRMNTAGDPQDLTATQARETIAVYTAAGGSRQSGIGPGRNNNIDSGVHCATGVGTNLLVENSGAQSVASDGYNNRVVDSPGGGGGQLAGPGSNNRVINNTGGGNVAAGGSHSQVENCGQFNVAVTGTSNRVFGAGSENIACGARGCRVENGGATQNSSAVYAASNGHVTHNGSLLLTPNIGLTNRFSNDNHQIRLGFSGITPIADHPLAQISDGRDKYDVQGLQYDPLQFISALNPVQYQTDSRELYYRWEECTDEEYEALKPFEKRHYTTNISVHNYEGTDIEWIEDDAVTRPHESPLNKYLSLSINCVAYGFSTFERLRP